MWRNSLPVILPQFYTFDMNSSWKGFNVRTKTITPFVQNFTLPPLFLLDPFSHSTLGLKERIVPFQTLTHLSPVTLETSVTAATKTEFYLRIIPTWWRQIWRKTTVPWKKFSNKEYKRRHSKVILCYLIPCLELHVTNLPKRNIVQLSSKQVSLYFQSLCRYIFTTHKWQ